MKHQGTKGETKVEREVCSAGRLPKEEEESKGHLRVGGCIYFCCFSVAQSVVFDSVPPMGYSTPGLPVL